LHIEVPNRHEVVMTLRAMIPVSCRRAPTA
jgi:hypothetical protein